MLGDAFLLDSKTPAEYNGSAQLSNIDDEPCDGGDTGDDNADAAISVYESLRDDMKTIVFLVLVKGTLGPIVAVLMMVSGIRYLSALAGAEVDVSALMRVV
jgi:hypothetical protein